jgi:diguanylate cyclase (GGDEF)-like protein
MKVLVAHSNAVSRRVLEAALSRLGHSTVVAESRARVSELLDTPSAPRLLLLDWGEQAGMEGIEFFRMLRSRPSASYVYALLVSSRLAKDQALAGLEAGADDYISEPLDMDELDARLRIAQRVLDLEAQLDRSRSYLTAVLANIESGVLLLDWKGRIAFANQALARMSDTGIDRCAGMLGHEFSALHGPRYLDKEDFLHAGRVGEANRPSGAGKFEVQHPAPKVFTWVTKPVSLPEGSGQLDVYQDVTNEAELARTLTQQAITDHTTGLINRRGGEEAVEREIDRARRYGTPLSFALLDIDHFKQFNDNHGHAAGDRVLREVCGTVMHGMRKLDLAVRWGGEELLVVLPGAHLEQAARTVERLRAAIENLKIEGLPTVTVSGGVAQMEPGETFDAALARADVKLYEAKFAGRNQVK